MVRFSFLILSLTVALPMPAVTPFDLEVLQAAIPGSMDPGESRTVEVRLANLGGESWDPETGFRVSSHWLKVDGSVIEWDGPRAPLPSVVGPGMAVSLELPLQAPRDMGEAVVQIDVVQEGVLWVSRQDPTPSPGTMVTIARTHAFVLLESRHLRWPRAGERLTARLSLGNEGGQTWSADGSFAVAAHWKRSDGGGAIWEGPRTVFAEDVPPGERVELTAFADVPANPGRWLLQWDVVHEGVCWFSERAEEAALQTVVVVVPGWADAWPALGLTLLLTVFAVGARREWWPAMRCAVVVDLVWLVVFLSVVEMTVGEVGFSGRLVSLACWGALAGVIFLVEQRWRPWFAWSAVLFFTALLVGDRMYLRFFGDLPSLGSLGAVGQAGRLSASIREILTVGDMALAASVVAGLALCAAASGLNSKKIDVGTRAVAACVLMIPAVIGLIFAAQRPAVEQVFRRALVARETGVIGAHVLDFGQWSRRLFFTPSPGAEKLAEIEAWFSDTAGGRSGTASTFGAARDLNLVMVQAESLQAFVLGLEVGGEEVTPTLNRWVDSGLSFTAVTDQTGHGRSSDAELLTQVSLLPLIDGAAAFVAGTNTFTSLAAVLGEEGYATLSAVPFDRTFWNRQITHRAYGYEENLFAEDFSRGPTVGWGLNDRDFLVQAVKRISRLSQPFCAWFITLSLHHPFEGFPDEFQELDVGAFEGRPIGEYLHTMRHLDHGLADLEDGLEAAGLLDETVIVLWGDHDAGFEWTDEVADLMGRPKTAAGWYSSQQIPLLIKAPARLGLVGSFGVPGGHVDVAPTVAALFGIDPAPLPWMGRNLLGAPGDEPVVGEYGCWTDRSNVFLQGDGGLPGGSCLNRFDLSPRPVEECGRNFSEAERRVRIAQLVLRHDLQGSIRSRMAGGDR